jgi:hypothetical protein
MTLKQRNPSDERSKIVYRPEKRRYGTKIVFQVLEKGFLGNLEYVTILLDDGTYVTLSPERQASWEGGQRFSLTLDGFPTASLAEEHGRRLVRGLLWTSISLDFGVRLNYNTHEPTTIYDRLRPPGLSMWGEGKTCFPESWVIDRLQAGYMLPGQIDRTLLLSMEIFSAAHLETSDRTIFLSAVSALEPLAKAIPLGSAVDTYVDECLTQLKSNEDIDPQLSQSIRGRLNELRKESIRQALKRLIRSKLPEDTSAPVIIDQAYSLRSQLIHSGTPDDLDIDFSTETQKVSLVVRKLYAKELGLVINGL